MKQTTRGADKIISSISDQLATGRLKVGDRLPAEAMLCEQFKTSRTVVREAIQQLKAIGVVRTVTGSGSYVADGNLNGFKNSLEFFSTVTGDMNSWIELLEMRILIESNCARNIAGERFSEKGLAQIKAVLDQMAENKNDTKLYSILDVEFHKTIIKNNKNKIFAAVLSSLENLQLRFSLETYFDENSEQLITRNFKEHAAIVEAIESRDPDQAELAMKNHLNATMKNLLLYIKNKQ